MCEGVSERGCVIRCVIEDLIGSVIGGEMVRYKDDDRLRRTMARCNWSYFPTPHSTWILCGCC